MPRPTGTSLNDSAGYIRYLEEEPDNQGTIKRWSGLRPFERDAEGRIILPVGERFCRMPYHLGDGRQLCKNDGLFSGHQNLKTHIRSTHKEVIAPTHRGGSTQAEIDEADRYYTLLVTRLISGDQGAGDIATPRKAAE